MNDRSNQPAEERQPRGRSLLYIGVVMAVPAFVYLTLTAILRERAAELPGAFLKVLLPFVFASPVLAFVSFVVAVFAFARFLHSGARRVTVAAVVWLCGAAAAYTYTAYDFASRLEGLSGLLHW